MPNISQPSRQGPYIAFCQAKLWRIILLIGLIFSPFAATAMCADFVVNFPQRDPLLAATRFIDLKSLAEIPKAGLTEKIAPYLNLQVHFETEVGELRTRVVEAPDRMTFDDLGTQLMIAETDQKLIHEYVALLERMAAKKFALPPADILRKHNVKTVQSDIQAMAEVAKDLQSLNKDRSKLVVRFLPIARQDLALAYGTDLYGQPFSSKETILNEGFMFGENEDLLRDRGLRMHDGFSAMSLEETQFHTHVNSASSPKNEDKVYAPHPDFSAFRRGEMAIAIYDLDKLDEAEFEFYIFKNPAERKKALLALIVPAKG